MTSNTFALLLALLATTEALGPLQNRKLRRQHLQPPGTPQPPPAQPATNLRKAVLAGVVEDHQFEQYFFDELTRNRVLELLFDGGRFVRPLLMCAPSLAVAADERGMKNYLLLDRDERFGFVSHFHALELEKPSESVLEACKRFDCDVIFCDPPFANFDLDQLRRALDELVPDPSVPLYLAYNGRREAELNAAFAGRQALVAVPDVPLGYESVKSSTQKRICLFGPSAEGAARS